MSISSTAEMKEANTIQADSGETKEAQNRNTDNVLQVVALPVQGESAVVPTHQFQNDKPSSIPSERALTLPNLKISEISNLPGNRPISASNWQVSQTVNVAGLRPIGSSSLQVSQTVNLMGNRPITLSTLHVSQTMLLSGLRPIASNDIDDSADLMGYLD